MQRIDRSYTGLRTASSEDPRHGPHVDRAVRRLPRVRALVRAFQALVAPLPAVRPPRAARLHRRAAQRTDPRPALAARHAPMGRGDEPERLCAPAAPRPLTMSPAAPPRREVREDGEARQAVDDLQVATSSNATPALTPPGGAGVVRSGGRAFRRYAAWPRSLRASSACASASRSSSATSSAATRNASPSSPRSRSWRSRTRAPP